MLLVRLPNFGHEYHNVDEIPSRITSSDQCKLTGLGKGEGIDGLARKWPIPISGCGPWTFPFIQSQRVEWPMSPLQIPFHYNDTKVKMPKDQDSRKHLFYPSPLQDITMLSGCGKAEREWEGHNNRNFEWDESPGLISYRGQSGHFAPTHFRQIERWLANATAK